MPSELPILDYALSRGVFWRKWLRRGVLAVVVLQLVWFVASIPSAVFTSVSYCAACGQGLGVGEMQIPGMQIAWWTTMHQFDTPLSLARRQAGMTDNHHHDHDWRFASGSGNGVRCALGTGSHLVMLVRNPMVIGYVQAVAEYEGIEQARERLHLLHESQTARGLQYALVSADFPMQKPSRGEYAQWTASQETHFERELQWYQRQ